MKERYSRNNIDMLVDTAGNRLTTAASIANDIRQFYLALVGSAAPNLQGVDLSIVRTGPTVTNDEAQSLIQPVTTQEI